MTKLKEFIIIYLNELVKVRRSVMNIKKTTALLILTSAFLIVWNDSVSAQNTGEKLLMSLKVTNGVISDCVDKGNIISLHGEIKKDGSIMEFNGEDSWISTVSPTFENNNIPFKIKLRFKTDSDMDQTIVSGIDGNSTSIFVGIREKKVVFMTYAKSPETLIGETEIADGQWHNITVIYKNNSKELYVDGKLEASVANITISGKSNGWRIGKQSELYSMFFKGQVSSVKISVE